MKSSCTQLCIKFNFYCWWIKKWLSLLLEYIWQLQIYVSQTAIYIPGSLAPQVLYSYIYRPRPQCNLSIIHQSYSSTLRLQPVYDMTIGNWNIVWYRFCVWSIIFIRVNSIFRRSLTDFLCSKVLQHLTIYSSQPLCSVAIKWNLLCFMLNGSPTCVQAEG